KQLTDLGVEVRTGTRATNLTEAGVQIGDEFIPCRVKIWAAGNNASFVGKTLGAPADRVGRVIVNDDLTIPRHPEVQVIGDLACLFVHIIFLVGFRNRLLVLFQWAWAYLTFDKGARLITRNFQSEQRPPA